MLQTMNMNEQTDALFEKTCKAESQIVLARLEKVFKRNYWMIISFIGTVFLNILISHNIKEEEFELILTSLKLQFLEGLNIKRNQEL